MDQSFHFSDESSTKRKKSKKSPIINLFKRSNTHKEESNPSSPSLGKLFGHCLSDVCEDDNIPKAIMVNTLLKFVSVPSIIKRLRCIAVLTPYVNLHLHDLDYFLDINELKSTLILI